MSNLLLGLLIGVIGGFSGAVIYLRTYLKSIEQTVFRVENEVKNFKVIYNIEVQSPSTSFDKKVTAQEDKDLFKPF